MSLGNDTVRNAHPSVGAQVINLVSYGLIENEKKKDSINVEYHRSKGSY